MSCNGIELVSQSGLEMAIARSSPSDMIEDFVRESAKDGVAEKAPDEVLNGLENETLENLEIAYLAVFALVTILVGLVSASLQLFRSNDLLGHPAVYATLALLLLLGQQFVLEAPLDVAWRESKASAESEEAKDDFVAKALSQSVFTQERKTFWFHLELLLLGVPALAFAYRILPDGSRRERRSEPRPESSPAESADPSDYGPSGPAPASDV
ncbi:MAG: hypothetical protein R3F20_18965 [Planctomycetota bacterium]